jgi:hypothetical protein
LAVYRRTPDGMSARALGGGEARVLLGGEPAQSLEPEPFDERGDVDEVTRLGPACETALPGHQMRIGRR